MVTNFDELLANKAMKAHFPSLKDRFAICKAIVNGQCRIPSGPGGGQFSSCKGISSLVSAKNDLSKALSQIPDTPGLRNGPYAKEAIKSIQNGKGKISSKNKMTGFIHFSDNGNARGAISFEEDKKHSKQDGLFIYALGSTHHGGGTALIKRVIQESIDRGYKGKITLKTDLDPKTLNFYLDKKRWSPVFGQCVKVVSHPLTKEDHQ